jgi:hypothetical protein
MNLDVPKIFDFIKNFLLFSFRNRMLLAASTAPPPLGPPATTTPAPPAPGSAEPPEEDAPSSARHPSQRHAASAAALTTATPCGHPEPQGRSTATAQAHAIEKNARKRRATLEATIEGCSPTPPLAMCLGPGALKPIRRSWSYLACGTGHLAPASRLLENKTEGGCSARPNPPRRPPPSPGCATKRPGPAACCGCR